MRNYQNALDMSLRNTTAFNFVFSTGIGKADVTTTMLVEVFFAEADEPTQYEVIDCVPNVPGTPAAREIEYLNVKYPTAAAFCF